MAEPQVPSIARIVHYQAHGSPNGEHKSEPRAAIITQVHGPACVGLAVITPTGFFFNASCSYDPDGGPGTWRWPTRV